MGGGFPQWHPGKDFAEVADVWQKEPDICRALEIASAEEYYAKYCGYDRLMLAAKAEIERLQAAHETAVLDTPNASSAE